MNPDKNEISEMLKMSFDDLAMNLANNADTEAFGSGDIPDEQKTQLGNAIFSQIMAKHSQVICKKLSRFFVNVRKMVVS